MLRKTNLKVGVPRDESESWCSCSERGIKAWSEGCDWPHPANGPTALNVWKLSANRREKVLSRRNKGLDTFLPSVLIFKMIIIGASGIRGQTIGPTLSISHTRCPQSEINWLHKQSCTNNRWKYGFDQFWQSVDWGEWLIGGVPNHLFCQELVTFSPISDDFSEPASWPNHTICQARLEFETLLLSSLKQFIKHKRHWVYGSLRSLFLLRLKEIRWI